MFFFCSSSMFDSSFDAQVRFLSRRIMSTRIKSLQISFQSYFLPPCVFGISHGNLLSNALVAYLMDRFLRCCGRSQSALESSHNFVELRRQILMVAKPFCINMFVLKLQTAPPFLFMIEVYAAAMLSFFLCHSRARNASSTQPVRVFLHGGAFLLAQRSTSVTNRCHLI